MTLEECNDFISKYQGNIRRDELAIASVLYFAKERLFGSDAEWIIWAESSHQISRREAYRLVKVHIWLESMGGHFDEVETLSGLPTQKLEILAGLSPDEFSEFRDTCDLAATPRDDLRELVRKFLDPTPDTNEKPTQLDFFAAFKLAEPEALDAKFATGEVQLPSAKAADYVVAFMGAVEVDELSSGPRRDYADALVDELLAVAANDPAKVLKWIKNGGVS